MATATRLPISSATATASAQSHRLQSPKFSTCCNLRLKSSISGATGLEFNNCRGLSASPLPEFSAGRVGKGFERSELAVLSMAGSNRFTVLVTGAGGRTGHIFHRKLKERAGLFLGRGLVRIEESKEKSHDLGKQCPVFSVKASNENIGQTADVEVDNLGVKVALSILTFYKREISPLLPRSCRYVPTCSEYSMQAYKKYGVVKGTVLTGWRICRCNPLGGTGFDPPRWFDEPPPAED